MTGAGGGAPSARGHAGSSRGGEQPSPVPVLLEVSRVVPLYSLVQDNVTKEVRKQQDRKSVCLCVGEWVVAVVVVEGMWNGGLLQCGCPVKYYCESTFSRLGKMKKNGRFL